MDKIKLFLKNAGYAVACVLVLVLASALIIIGIMAELLEIMAELGFRW